jgi:biopolymer transport protein ExbD
MAINVRGAEEDEVLSTINTTPLVEVMLVLLIIFLITIPVVTHTVPISLPKEANQPTQTTPQNIIIAINREGDAFWNQERVADSPALLARLKQAAALNPQPEVHIRGDEDARYEFIGKVMVACERAGILKVAFITEPPPRGG